MIVVSLIALLATIALPKMSETIRKANERSGLAKLSALRSALANYYSDTEGTYPADLGPLTSPGNKYLDGDILLYTANHGSLGAVTYAADQDFGADDGSWGYVNSGSLWGTLWVRCTHTDAKGNVWTSY